MLLYVCIYILQLKAQTILVWIIFSLSGQK